MAEDDWYGPFAGFNWSHWAVLISSLVAGVFFTVSGFLGYDTGRRWSTDTIPEQTRWMGEILWDEIALGCFAFGWAYLHYRKLRNKPGTPQKGDQPGDNTNT
jgi:hypothetical protein